MNCPKCGGPMWDNRGRKKNPKGPDFSCKDKNCRWKQDYDGKWIESSFPTAIFPEKSTEIRTFPQPQSVDKIDVMINKCDQVIELLHKVLEKLQPIDFGVKDV